MHLCVIVPLHGGHVHKLLDKQGARTQPCSRAWAPPGDFPQSGAFELGWVRVLKLLVNIYSQDVNERCYFTRHDVHSLHGMYQVCACCPHSALPARCGVTS